MPARVSMVMPCYNKQAAIGRMLDTVLAQGYDSLELILVNDGSTDSTRAIITDYLPLLEKRGFTVELIDQPNAGVCAAAQAGLARVSGEYVCLVDSDDELDPAYVKTLADWLDAHPDCDFVVCGADEFIETPRSRTYRHGPSQDVPQDFADRFGVPHFLMGEVIRSTVWVYMVRKTYLDRCHVVDSYHTQTRGSHEPGFVIPLLAHKGKRAYIPQALYHFNESGEGHSQTDDINRALSFYETYDELCRRAIDSLPDEVAPVREKCYLKRVSLLSREYHLYRRAVVFGTDAPTLAYYRGRLAEAVNTAFSLEVPLTADSIEGSEFTLIDAFLDIIFDRDDTEARRAFPQLQGGNLHG